MAIRRNIPHRPFCSGALLALGILCTGAAPAVAEIRVVEIGRGTLTIEAHDATLREVLEALSDSRMIQFRSSDVLSQVVTGSYSGTLPRVLSRILDGHNFVIQST